ncbi:dimethyladenosine transferase [Solihabitans fulvus]|uniref:Dimethyladenosine transferase n=1 Tax=Solihabitans fulvus TaxID=1892852 RepID=A0A5B2WWS4_9PSEU|nr:SRPBCC family protein [Solihabitans fulvus]KAA2254906.1 dimethyladenosine transferase [Solihabitans fulvus]
MAARQISVTRTIDAPAERIFDLLADPSKHQQIDGSGSIRALRAGGSQRLALGSTFGMDMRAGMPYRVTNRVVEFAEGELIAWRHFMGHRWRWRLRDTGSGGTEVTETFDYSTVPFVVGKMFELMGIPKSNRKAMEATLTRLAEVLAE